MKPEIPTTIGKYLVYCGREIGYFKVVIICFLNSRTCLTMMYMLNLII